MLILVATPIGNLKDISFRALEALKGADLILCEDTRHSKILLDHYGIEKPLWGYHKFTEQGLLKKILERLKEGQTLALISDAGTPCLNDPGAILVQACIEEKIPFTAIPGPCSPITALLLSGFDTIRFQFVGFLPKKTKEILRSLLSYPGTTIAFEGPSRLIDTLQEIVELDPERKIAVAREMTKTFEECQRGSAREVLSHFEASGVKGEICLVIGQGKLPEEALSLEELVGLLQELHGLSLKEAIKLAAKFTQRPKSQIYRHFHKESS